MLSYNMPIPKLFYLALFFWSLKNHDKKTNRAPTCQEDTKMLAAIKHHSAGYEV